jgi:hypothetical protein
MTTDEIELFKWVKKARLSILDTVTRCARLSYSEEELKELKIKLYQSSFTKLFKYYEKPLSKDFLNILEKEDIYLFKIVNEKVSSY